MILFLTDHDKMENTCTCLNIIKIEPNVWSPFFRDSISKIFCSREQSTSHVHAHTFIELKKKSNKSYKIVRFRQGFAKRSMASSREFAWFEFFWFLCSLVLHLFWSFYPRVPLFSRSVHGQQRRAFYDTKLFLQEVLEPNFSMGCNVGEIGNDLASDPQTLSTTIWTKYYPGRKKRKNRQIHGKL